MAMESATSGDEKHLNSASSLLLAKTQLLLHPHVLVDCNGQVFRGHGFDSLGRLLVPLLQEADSTVSLLVWSAISGQVIDCLLLLPGVQSLWAQWNTGIKPGV